MEMNSCNTSEANDSGETLSQDKAVKETQSPKENCSGDKDTAQNSKTRGMTSKRKFRSRRRKSRETNQKVDPRPTNQNCDTDSHPGEEKMTTEPSFSDTNTPSSHSEREGECSKTVFSADCDTSEESTEAASLKNCDHSDNTDSRRTRRSSKRKRDAEDCCPVCGITLRHSQMLSHYAKEVDNLSKLSRSVRRFRSEDDEGVNTTFVQVKSNRENRHAAKVAQFSRPRNEVYCPVCKRRLAGPQYEINDHVLICITQAEYGNEFGDGLDNEVNVVDDDDEDSFEEYEFGDQTRVRAISMVRGGYRSLQGDSSRPRRSNDDEDLDVDVDDTLAYGNPQYTELDVIPNRTDDTDKERTEQLRKAVLLNPSAERNVLESRKWNNNDDGPSSSDGSSFSLLDKIKKDDNESQDGLEEKLEKAEDQENCENKDEDDTVSSLKEKIKNLEDQTNNVKCLICLEPYTKPVVSTTCWHVHCEECWLMTMGVKKLCPQCNIIVFPSDLRRIYL